MLGVVAGCTLIWGSLAALNRFVLGFHAWPTPERPSAQRIVVPDAPRAVVTHRASERVALAGGLAAPASSLLPGGTVVATLLGGPGTSGGSGGSGTVTGGGVVPSSGSPIGAPGGVLGPGTGTPGGRHHVVAPTPTTAPTTQPVGQTTPAATDTDGDGIPDAYEISHGLNPNNPADGAATPNGDGVTNVERYRRQLAANQKSGTDKGTTTTPVDTPATDPTTTADPAPVTAPDPAPAPDPTPDPSQTPAVTPDPVVPADPAPTDPAPPPAPDAPSGGVQAPDEPPATPTDPAADPTPPAASTPADSAAPVTDPATPAPAGQ